MDTNKMRESFENAWLLNAYPGGDPEHTRSYGDLTIDVYGNYLDPILHHAWWAWQASRAAMAVELPSESCIRLNEYTPYEAVEACKRAVEAQGLEVAP